jgi:glycosyltransferase involved in cell wall biosynthesis
MQSPLWSLADPWLLLPAVRRAGVPAVTATVHNVLPHRRRRYHPRAYARLYDRLDGVAVHAAEHASALERCPAHVVLTPFGDHGPALPPPDPSGGPRALLELPDETAVVLFFGQIRPNKGLGDLIEALADTADRVALVVAGEPLEPLDGYVRAAARLGVNLALDESLLGYLDGARAASCIAGSDVMVLPYRSGWNSGVLSLCAHYRRPTVVTTVAAAPEDLARVPSGGVCPPRDPAALRTAIERALRGELAAPEMFPGWGAVAEAHLELWKRVLGVR